MLELATPYVCHALLLRECRAIICSGADAYKEADGEQASDRFELVLDPSYRDTQNQ